MRITHPAVMATADSLTIIVVTTSLLCAASYLRDAILFDIGSASYLLTG